MAKKKVTEKAMGKFASEKSLGRITKLLEKQNIQTVDEANKFLQNLVSNPDSLNDPFFDDNQTALEKAQNLIYDADDEVSSAKRIKLAKKALSISKDCADAYNLLAEESDSLDEVKELYYCAIEAGRRAIGKKNFEQMKGEFWGFHETRPFMRAMAGLSNVLWELNQQQESVDVLKEMLTLNPNDNQGMRYSLINKLLMMRKFVETEKLLKEYNDDYTAHWLYSKAYLFFNKPSKKNEADKILIEAMKFNPYVPLYLFGIKEMPEELPDYMGIGDDTEAISYVEDSLEVWGSNKTATHWFASLYKKMETELNDMIVVKEKEREEQFKNFGKITG